MISEKGILYIEPSANTSAEPVIDELTRKMASAFREGVGQMRFRGFHKCECGAESTNTDYKLPNGERTNSLCVHYLAFHRAEVPAEQLIKVANLTYGEKEPTAEELARPGSRSPSRRILR